jgi:hypothetical protein
LHAACGCGGEHVHIPPLTFCKACSDGGGALDSRQEWLGRCTLPPPTPSMNPSIVPSNPSKPMVTDACGLRHYILVNITRCAVWRLCYQSVSADLTAPHLQLGPCRRSPTGADLDSRTPAIIVLPVSCPVVPLGPSHWRVGWWQRGQWHKSRHLRARRVFVQHATPARREKLCTCHGPRLAVVCTCFGLQCLAPSGLTCRCLQPNKGPPDAKRIAQNK